MQHRLWMHREESRHDEGGGAGEDGGEAGGQGGGGSHVRGRIGVVPRTPG